MLSVRSLLVPKITKTWEKIYSVPRLQKVGKIIFLVLILAGNTVVAVGQLSFSSAIDFPVGQRPFKLSVGDFNGDGNLDLAVPNENGGTVSILLGIGNGSFGMATDVPVGSTPVETAIGDLNRDFKLDLAVVNRSSNSVSILLGDGMGSFSAALNVAVGNFPNSVAIGDLNKDGNPDLAVTNIVSGTVDVPPELSSTQV